MLLGRVESGADERAARRLRSGGAPRGPGRAARASGCPLGALLRTPPASVAAVPAARTAPLRRFGGDVAGRDRRGLRPGPARLAAGLGGGPALFGLPRGFPERVV